FRASRRLMHVVLPLTVHPGRLRGKTELTGYRERGGEGGQARARGSALHGSLFMIDEAAHHLGLPRSTLSDWTRRQAGPAPLVHGIEPETPRSASLPFVSLVEAHMLRGFRELGLSAQGLRESVTRLREKLGDEYALATRNVATDGVDLLVNMAESHEEPQWVR